MNEHIRQRIIQDYNRQISETRNDLAQCDCVCSEEARHLGQKLTKLIRDRNTLFTQQEIHAMEQQRGLSA